MLGFDNFANDLYSGDPEVRGWSMVENDYLPLMLCLSYAIFTKILGPALMRHRQPFHLRIPMMIYNLSLVISYSVLVWKILNFLMVMNREILCHGGLVIKGDISYDVVTCAWKIYLLKYVEFFDTIFFVLRKKDYLVTNLHVIHHFSLPLYAWILLRTEKSGASAFPVVLNSIVHICMYSYYGLAAMGPSVQKYLWWKKYLTIMQMGQFVLILIFGLLVPFTGCKVYGPGFTLTILIAVTFLPLFYNFYYHTFNKKTARNGRKKKLTEEDN